MEENYISIVIISKNEEKNIGKSIESALQASKEVGNGEVILVDSASTDGTMDIAKQYPIKILQLDSSFELSPSAGSYIGSIYSSGEYILFLGGDQTIEKTWLKHTSSYLENENVAGIAGIMYNILPGEDLNFNHRIEMPLGKVNTLGGPALYKRKILNEVGTFNPFMKGEEERELGYRITHEERYVLLRLPSHMAYHFTKKPSRYEIRKKIQYFMGTGQFIRMHFSISVLYEIMKEYKRIFLHICGISFLLISILLLIIFGYWLPIYISGLGFILYIGVLLLVTRELAKVRLFIEAMILSSVNLLIGFFKPPKDPSAYPTNVKVIK